MDESADMELTPKIAVVLFSAGVPKMNDIIIATVKEGEELDALSADYLFKILDGNRTRLRTVNTLVITVSGFVLSTSFLTLFFILQNEKLIVFRPTIYALLLTIASTVASILFNISSAMLYQPSSPLNKADLIDRLASIYEREHRKLGIAVLFLIIAIALFTLSLLILALSVLG